MARNFDSDRADLSDPIESAAAVTPGTSALAGGVTRALWIGGAGSGNLNVTMADGTTIAFAGVPVGILPIRVTHVLASGTDVTGIRALY